MQETLSLGYTRAETEDWKNYFFHLQPKMSCYTPGITVIPSSQNYEIVPLLREILIYRSFPKKRPGRFIGK